MKKLFYYLKALVFYHSSGHFKTKNKIKKVIGFSLFCFFAHSSDKTLNSKCYKLFSSADSRPILKLSQDSTKRPMKNTTRYSVEKMQLDPEKYAEDFNLKKGSTEREEFIKIVKTSSAQELEIEKKSHLTGHSIKRMSLISKPTRKPPYHKTQPAPKQQTQIKPVSKSKKESKLKPKTLQAEQIIENETIEKAQKLTEDEIIQKVQKLTEDEIIKKAQKMESKILSLLEKIEEELKKTQPQKTSDKLTKMKKELAKIKKNLIKFPNSPKIWGNYDKQVENIKKELNIIDRQREITTLEELIKYPSSLLPDYNYSANLQDESYEIQFNKQVAEALSKLDPKKTTLILKKMGKGFVRQKREDGIKILYQNASSKSRYENSLVELKTIGSSAGHIRIGGCKKGNIIRWVLLISESDHSKQTAKQNFKKKIYQICQKEGFI